MKVTISLGIFIAVLLSTPAKACSCHCKYGHSISEYMQTHDVFWGLPKISRLTSDNLVTSEVEVLESYGRLNSNSNVTIISQPDDGGSCGIQLYTGIPQLIISKKSGQLNVITNCNCEPPSDYLIKYLKEGTDLYLPNLDKCRDDDDNIKPTKVCKIWGNISDEQLKHNELQRMYKVLQKNK